MDVPLVAQHFFHHAGWCDKLRYAIPGNIDPRPLGVCAQVIPWNFPLMMAAWKIAPAIACGNTVVLKPAETTSLTALRLAEIFRECGLPEGVVNIVTGAGETGRYLVEHPGVDKVAFTGSTDVGKKIAHACAGTKKRITLELGGKSPNIVFADANLEKAASSAALAVYWNGGQTCTAGTRLIVEESILDDFMARVIEESKAWMPGDPMDPATVMGPMIDAAQCKTVCDYVAIGQEEGAELVFGGTTTMEDTGGHYHEPTIFTGVSNDMRIAQEEIFGPVLSVLSFKTAEEAVQIANDSIYGLAGAVWSRDINTAHKVAAAVRVGTMGINNYFGGDSTVPFGGFKQSGNGRDKSMHAFDDYTELKTTWIEFE